LLELAMYALGPADMGGLLHDLPLHDERGAEGRELVIVQAPCDRTGSAVDAPWHPVREERTLCSGEDQSANPLAARARRSVEGIMRHNRYSGGSRTDGEGVHTGKPLRGSGFVDPMCGADRMCSCFDLGPTEAATDRH
jgi:hypothetical protein